MIDPRCGPSPRIGRRRWLVAAIAASAGIAGCSGHAAVGAGAPSQRAPLRLLGSATLAYRQQFKGTTVGGLSGIDHDPVDDLWYAISDADAPARFYTLRTTLSAQGMSEPQLVDVVTMKQADGTPYPRRGPGRLLADPESIRLRPDTRTLLWTSEGSRRHGVDPFVREMTLDGRHLRELPLPAAFAVNPDADTGPRHNGAFEGLALTADGCGAWVAMEHPLLQDGPASSVEAAGAPCRFTLFDLASGKPVQQFAYRPESIRRLPIPGLGFADNGVSEILMVDAHRMLVLERGFSLGAGVSLRLFMVDVRQPDDTLGLPTLRTARPVEVARKTLIADFDKLGLPRLDNTEGMAWGPPLRGAGGTDERTLLFVSDDNFNPLQITQFAAFAWHDPAVPASAPAVPSVISPLSPPKA